MVFKIPDHPEFEFIRESKSLESAEYRAKATERVLTTIEVAEGSILVVLEFINIFSEEYRLLPKRAIEFSIEFIPDATLISKALYRITTLELDEVK